MKRTQFIVCGILTAVLALAFTACRGPTGTIPPTPTTGSIAGTMAFPDGAKCLRLHPWQCRLCLQRTGGTDCHYHQCGRLLGYQRWYYGCAGAGAGRTARNDTHHYHQRRWLLGYQRRGHGCTGARRTGTTRTCGTSRAYGATGTCCYNYDQRRQLLGYQRRG